MDARALLGFHIDNPIIYARNSSGIDELFKEAKTEKSDIFFVATDQKDVVVGTAHEEDYDMPRAFYLCSCMAYFGVRSSFYLEAKYIAKSIAFATEYRRLGK